MRKDQNKAFKLLSTDYIQIKHPDQDDDVYLVFKDEKTGEEYQIYITVESFVDSFKKSYLDKVVNDYTDHLKYHINN